MIADLSCELVHESLRVNKNARDPDLSEKFEWDEFARADECSEP